MSEKSAMILVYSEEMITFAVVTNIIDEYEPEGL
jgi:hypothetical protein